MTRCEITDKWHIFITERKKYKLTWMMILIDSQVEGLFDRGVCHWGVICSCKADLGPVVGGDQRGVCCAVDSAHVPIQFHIAVMHLPLKEMGFYVFFSKIFFEDTHQGFILRFCLWWKTRALVSCLSSMSLIMIPLPVRVSEAFPGQICGCLSGLGCQIFTSCLGVGWVLRCLNGPALHCHSPSHRRDPGSGEKH